MKSGRLLGIIEDLNSSIASIEFVKADLKTLSELVEFENVPNLSEKLQNLAKKLDTALIRIEAIAGYEEESEDAEYLYRLRKGDIETELE